MAESTTKAGSSEIRSDHGAVGPAAGAMSVDSSKGSGTTEGGTMTPAAWILSRHRWVPRVMVLVALAGLLVVFILVRRAERERIQAEFERWAEIPRTTLQRDLDNYPDLLLSIGAFFFSSREVERSEFHRFNEDALERLRALRVLGWAPRVPEAQRTAHEDAAKEELGDYRIIDLDAQGRRHPASGSTEYLPLLYVEPPSALLTQQGVNLAGIPSYVDAMEFSLETGAPVAVPVDPGRHAGGRAGDWCVFLGAFTNGVAHATIAERRKHLAGYIVETVALSNLIQGSLTSAALPLPGTVAVQLIDLDEGNPTLFQSPNWPAGSARAAKMEIEMALDFGQRSWVLLCRPTPVFLYYRRVWKSWGVLWGGLALTALLAGYLRSAANRTARIEQLVHKRTAELEQANQSLRTEIRERERAEQKLAQEQFLVKALMDTIPDSIYFKDTQSRFLRINKAQATRFKLKNAAEAEGRTDADFFTPEHAQAALADEQAILRTGEPLVSREEKETWPDGSVTWASTTKQCLRDPHGTVIGTFGVSRDITARKQAEQALAEKSEELQRSNQELELFAYVASHDLQEPLRMVTSYLQLIERRYGETLDATAREFIGFAVDGGRRMQQLINDLLAYSRVGTRGKPFTPVNLQEVCATALTNLKVALEDTGATVTVDALLPTVPGDAGQLTQVFQNLVGNAIKFRKAGEPIRVHVQAERRETQWRLAVRDNGIGIDPQHFDRIFLIFQRLHSREEYSGTGLGLAICKKIVERHGGRMGVESQPGQGSTFWFTLPSAPPAVL